MDGWTQDLLVNLIGTFIGALAALASGWWFRRRQQRRDETRLVQDLVNVLYWKRALSHRNIADDRSSGWDEDDRQRCTTSILDARSRIGEVANRMSVSKHAQAPLDEMQRSCVAWLRYSGQHPSDYVAGLVELRRQLAASERMIADKQRKLVLREPGGVDVDPPRLFNRA